MDSSTHNVSPKRITVTPHVDSIHNVSPKRITVTPHVDSTHNVSPKQITVSGFYTYCLLSHGKRPVPLNFLGDDVQSVEYHTYHTDT